jgi:phthiocerol/phenolphthiocerol synthesis type-I polyketide synthase A
MSPNPVPVKPMSDGAVRMSMELVELVGQLAERDESHPVTLWIITRGVREGSSDAAVAQSPMWGTAGVIRAEQPQLWGGLVDLPDGADIAGLVPALSTVLRTAGEVDSGAARRRVPGTGPGAGVRRAGARAAAMPPGCGVPDHRWSGCARSADGRLARRPRRAPSDPGRPHRVATPPRLGQRQPTTPTPTEDQRHPGAGDARRRRRSRALDIGSHDAMQALLAKRDAEGAVPIRGVVHGAGITDAHLFTELDEDRLRRTIWPKIAGAQVLHQTFPPGSLDFLFLTAAAGAVFGVPGQGAYAAANAYLDGLAQLRHRQGCHTVSQDWVAWRGLGFGAEAQIALQELERLGSRPITADEAFAAWDHLARYDVAQAVMAPMPSADGAAAAEPLATSPAWSEMPAEDVVSELQAGLRASSRANCTCPKPSSSWTGRSLSWA